MATLEVLPLLRNGEEYFSRSKLPLRGIHGERLAEVSIAPEIHVQMALPINKRVGFNSLQSLSIDELVTIYSEAGKIFSSDMEIGGVNTSLDEWAELITLSTGLPIRHVINALNVIKATLTKRNLRRILKANSPTNSINIYDELIGEKKGIKFAFTPRGRNVGISLPGNHPAVALLGILIPLFKIPAIIRSSSREPFTSFRLAKALWEAGLPPEALFHFVTQQDVVDTLLTKSDLGMIFGSEWVIKHYEHYPTVKTFGPGRSKVIVDFSSARKSFMNFAIDIADSSITTDGGRGCINASTIIFSGNEGYEYFKEELAQRLASIEPEDPMNFSADIPALLPSEASQLHSYIKSRMNGRAFDLTSKYRNNIDFIVEEDGLAYLLPTLIEVDEEHQMLNDEYPFPFGIITKAEDYYPIELARDSLSVALLTDDPSKVKHYLLEPTIKKVFLNDPTFIMDPAAPHEGFLTEFLYQTKASNL